MAANEEERASTRNEEREECLQVLEECRRKLRLLEDLTSNMPDEQAIEAYFEGVKRQVLEQRRLLVERVDAHFDQELADVDGREKASKMGG
jgi:hypothetical protein